MVSALGGKLTGGALVVTLASVAWAQTAPPSEPNPTEKQAPPAPSPSAVQQPQQPVKPVAEAGPWSFTGVLTGDLLADLAGGQTIGAKPLAKLALSAAWDGRKVRHDGLSGLVSIQYVAGGHLTADNVGDIQGADNIEAPGAVRLYEAWLSRDYDNEKGWKGGLIDLNTDFDTQEVGALFLNSSNGVGPELSHSGLNGPSIFPVTAVGVTGYWRPNGNWTLRGGIFDGTAGSPTHPHAFVAIHLSGSDGLFAIVQAERRFGNGLRLEAGGWVYTSTLDSVREFASDGTPLRERRARGAYATLEAPLFTPADDPERGLAGWVRVGLADPVVQRVHGYIGGGVVYSGLFRKRPQDQLGFAISHAITDAPFDSPGTPMQSSETAYELTYRYNLNEWLSIQPDAQYVVHPNGDRSIGNAVVIGVRFTVTAARSLLRKVREAVGVSP